jgi:hypothetical protein
LGEIVTEAVLVVADAVARGLADDDGVGATEGDAAIIATPTATIIAIAIADLNAPGGSLFETRRIEEIV